MTNLTQHRKGFKFDHLVSEDGNKKSIVRLEVFYLAGASRKGIVFSIRPMTIEQGEGYTSELFLLYNSDTISTYVKVLARKSDKELVKMAEYLDPFVPSLMETFVLQGKDAALVHLRKVVQS